MPACLATQRPMEAVCGDANQQEMLIIEGCIVLSGRYDSGGLNYPFLESRRSRGGGPFSGGEGSSGVASGLGGSSRSSGLGTSLLAGGRSCSSGSSSSDAMQPPPGEQKSNMHLQTCVGLVALRNQHHAPACMKPRHA